MNHDPARESAPRQRGRAPVLLRTLWSAPYILLTLAVLFWSGNFIVGRAVSDLVPPVALAFWRWTAGLVIVLAFGWRHVIADLHKLKASWPILVILAALGIATFNTFVYLGLHTTTALNAVLLQSAMPIVIIVMTFVFFGERPGFAPAVGVAVSMAGVATIASAGDWSALASLTINRGDLWVLAAVGAYALYSVLLRKRPDVHPLSFLAATFALGALMLVPLLVYEHFAIKPLEPSVTAFLAIAYVAVFPAVLSYLFFNRGVELAGANAAGHFIHLIPLFGSALAILLLGESLASFHILGGILIASGLILATVGRS
jgi:drug/metabolite transporter (DMT)-like permease